LTFQYTHSNFNAVYHLFSHSNTWFSAFHHKSADEGDKAVMLLLEFNLNNLSFWDSVALTAIRYKKNFYDLQTRDSFSSVGHIFHWIFSKEIFSVKILKNSLMPAF
jgi:hypothetical protein